MLSRMSEQKILLADDDEELCQLLRDFLEREGFEVEVAHDGATALERAAAGGYDAMILDVMLPQVSGLELLRELRRSSQLPARASNMTVRKASCTTSRTIRGNGKTCGTIPSGKR